MHQKSSVCVYICAVQRIKNRNLVRVDRKKEKGFLKRISPEIGAGRGNESRHPVKVKKGKC